MKVIVNYIKQICGPSKFPGGNRPQKMFLLGSWAFFALIGLFIPENILRDHAWARDFTDAVASIVPQIDRITALNLRPDINRFHYSLLWVVSPVYLLIFYSSGNEDVVRGYNRLPAWQIAVALLLTVYGIGFAMYLWYGLGFFEPDNSIARVMFYYLLSRAICAPIFATMPIYFSVALLLILKGIFSGHILER